MNHGGKIALGVVLTLIVCPAIGFGIWVLLQNYAPSAFPLTANEKREQKKGEVFFFGTASTVALYCLITVIPIIFAAIYFSLLAKEKRNHTLQ